MATKMKATIDRKSINNKEITAEDLIKLKNKLSKDELLITALAFGHCVMLISKYAKVDIPLEFSSVKEAKRLVRALRKQGKDSV